MSKEHLVTAGREYAKLWLSRERQFVDDLASNDRSRRLAALQAAGGYFRVSRSFSLQFDVKRGLKRLAPALDVLERVAPTTLADNVLASTVDTLRRELGRPYGGKDLLSAATKFLWLCHRDAVIIHDSQVRSALGAGAVSGAVSRVSRARSPSSCSFRGSIITDRTEVTSDCLLHLELDRLKPGPAKATSCW